MTAPSAQEIYQDWLDRMAKAVWERDMPTILGGLGHPHKMQTHDAMISIETQEETMELAEDFRDFLERIGAQAYHRICAEAAFTDDLMDRIEGRHTTYILKGGSYLVEPFSNRMTLQRRGTDWVGVDLRLDVSNSKFTVLSPAYMRRARLSGSDCKGGLSK